MPKLAQPRDVFQGDIRNRREKQRGVDLPAPGPVDERGRLGPRVIHAIAPQRIHVGGRLGIGDQHEIGQVLIQAGVIVGAEQQVAAFIDDHPAREMDRGHFVEPHRLARCRQDPDRLEHLQQILDRANHWTIAIGQHRQSALKRKGERRGQPLLYRDDHRRGRHPADRGFTRHCAARLSRHSPSPPSSATRWCNSRYARFCGRP